MQRNLFIAALAALVVQQSFGISPGTLANQVQWAGVGSVWVYSEYLSQTHQEGSGFAISDRHLMTAYHVIWDTTRPGYPPLDPWRVAWHANPTENLVFPTAIHYQYLYTNPLFQDIAILEFPPGTFATWYSPYYGPGGGEFAEAWETGLPVVVLGAGWRGIPVQNAGAWKFEDDSEGDVRMGTNTVDYGIPAGWDPEAQGGLRFTMDYPNEVSPDECCVGPRDSGGPTLIWANGAWRSIGLHVLQDGNPIANWGGYGSGWIDQRLYPSRNWIQSIIGN